MVIVKTHPDTLRLLVLVPHRDARLPLRAWSGALFAAGLEGAWSFPWVAPLAVIASPFSAAELRTLALALREQLPAAGKITTGPPAIAAFSSDHAVSHAGAAVFGPVLNIELVDSIVPPGAAGKIMRRCSPPVLGAALIRRTADGKAGGGLGETRQEGPLSAAIPAPPALSFRAAALANMRCRFQPTSTAGYSFEWEIGELRWLQR
jgi:hypothetical protein